jgi:hypothetical protein
MRRDAQRRAPRHAMPEASHAQVVISKDRQGTNRKRRHKKRRADERYEPEEPIEA